MGELYGKRDERALDRAGNHFCKHMLAMTAEGLCGKSEIAAELAYRDATIDRLMAALATTKQALATCCCVAQDAAKAAAGYWPNDKCPAPAPKNE